MTCSAINTGEVGVPFNSGPITVTGGTAPYTFSIVGHVAGRSDAEHLDRRGDGHADGVRLFSIKVTDANGVAASRNCAFTIIGPPQVTCSAINSGEVGVPFNSGPITVTGEPRRTRSRLSGRCRRD